VFGNIIAALDKTEGETCAQKMKKTDKEGKKEDIKEEELIKEEKSLNNDEEDKVDDEADIDEQTPEEKMATELAEAKDKYLRLYSEFDNFRRRTAKEKLDLMQTASERVLVSLLSVLDDFSRAEQSLESQDPKALAEGMKLIADKFTKTLKAEGLELMKTKPGTNFDTELHEAVTQIPAPSKKLKGKIVETIEQGYFLGDKVIRHAKVILGA